MSVKHIIISFWICLLATGSTLQANVLPIEEDTLKPSLSIDELYQQILLNHPIARQAFLLTEEARQQLRMARGFFDPKISSQFDRKEFKDTEYYQVWDSKLKIPTRFVGIDLIGGFERNTGEYLSEQLDTDSGNGLAYGGLSIPIGQGLIIDERRTVLRKAQIFQDIAEAEQVKVLNKLFLQVAKDYWQWYFYHNQYLLLQEGYNLAEFRFKAVKVEVEQGAAAAIDSVEAKITMQQREIDLKTAEIQLTNSRLILSNHLWGENEEPLELEDNVTPPQNAFQNLSAENLRELQEYALENHPELLKVRFKLDQLDFDRRLAAEMLKPTLNLKYNFLAQTVSGSNNDFDAPFFQNNYKFGIDFSFPLFLRKERGKLAMTNIKIENTSLERTNLERVIINEIIAVYNEVRNLVELLEMQEDMVSNYERLVAGEKQKFRNGDSSLFLVNVREGKLIESRVKLFSMRHKYAKSLAELRWAAGLGFE